MNTDRLLKLADYLETVVAKTPERFDMDFFGRNSESCGTVCCALGHACSIPEFATEGLQMIWEQGGGTVYFRRSCDFTAAELFFEIDGEGAEYLFSADEFDQKSKPTDVATRIREFVAANGIPR